VKTIELNWPGLNSGLVENEGRVLALWVRRLTFNPLNAELNPICHLLSLGAHHILHVGRIRVNAVAVDKG
jgi:hypothetical protein